MKNWQEYSYLDEELSLVDFKDGHIAEAGSLPENKLSHFTFFPSYITFSSHFSSKILRSLAQRSTDEAPIL
ncbi:MAG: hypothetical protein K9M99_00920 [Candidatus Cloacimonetes bacterium]|nr:hypothetical protein [Candidatus Cloacimonadota bacterium]